MNRLLCPALFRHLLRRFWPFMAAIGALLALRVTGVASLTLVYRGIVSGAGAGPDPVGTLATVQSAMGPALCFGAAVACPVSALLVLRHLRDRSEAQYYLGMPLSRTCMFATCHVSALCLVALPGAVVAALVAVLELLCGYASALPDLAALVVSSAFALLLFSGLASLSCVATGRAGAAVLAYVCLNVAVIAVYGASRQLLSQFLVGVPLDAGAVPDAVMWLTPALNFSVVWDRPMAAVYAVAGVLLAVASGALYRARPTERAGEAMAFVGSRIAFQVLVTLVVAALATMVAALWQSLGRMGQSPRAAEAVLVAVFAAVGWVSSEMLVRRTPRVFDLRTLKGCVSTAGAFVVVLALLATDAFGVVRWVPDPADVERAEVAYLGESGEVDPADAVAVHRAVLDNRDLLERPAPVYRSYKVRISYDMADGSHAERSYSVYEPSASEDEPPSDVKRAVMAAFDAPDVVYRDTFGTDRELSQADIAQVNYELQDGYLDTGRPYTRSWAPFGRVDAYNLYRAAVQDIREGNVSRFSGDEIGSITFELRPGVADVATGSDASRSGAPVASDSEEPPRLSDGGTFTGHLAITPAMEHTLAWIEAFELQADWQDRSDDAGGAS